EPALYQVSITGGRAPYTLQVHAEIVSLAEDGNTSAVEVPSTTVEAEGTAPLLYAPVRGGIHTLTVSVTDADSRSASAQTRLPVSVRTGETEADWRASFAQAQLTGDLRSDVIAIARTQLGYTASRTDFSVQPGGDWMHYSRYGAWYGSPYINWCAAFAGFCLHYAGAAQLPFHSNCGEWLARLQAQGLYRPADAYFPLPGDVVLIDHDGNGTADHAGLVEALTVTRTGDETGFRFTLTTIEGNREGQVGCFSYDASDATILGYGQIAGSVSDGFTAVLDELDAFDAAQRLSESEEGAAGLFFRRLQAAYDAGLMSEATFDALWQRLGMMLYGDVAERAEGTNWMRLRSSGWFQAYSAYANAAGTEQAAGASAATYALRSASTLSLDEPSTLAEPTATPPSDQQVVERGGRSETQDGVSVSKTIAGTDRENVFDITLQVQTSMNVEEVITEPDMAVVIVMDISNTMNSNFGGVTRYAAAMTAAENFLDQFAANNTLGISKVGYVAFNTDAHQIFGLQPCATQAQAEVLKNTMRSQTGPIINADGYSESHSRFTNVEAGLAMAASMLSGVSNQNKYIIFLSDGFPTTYIKSGYS
ncbi:MAG: vWA domain-containing protein, partial [Aristaeellaceae bacterium]